MKFSLQLIHTQKKEEPLVDSSYLFLKVDFL